MNRSAVKILLYISALVLANFIVLWFGAKGLIITALFLIPFDFVMRCVFHERWRGIELFTKLGSLILFASLITYLINSDTKSIALASSVGFLSAQVAAGVFYQLFIKHDYLIKVNGSDIVGIVVDSILFQLIAFGTVELYISLGQISLKVIGGLFWYWVLFEKVKIQKSF